MRFATGYFSLDYATSPVTPPFKGSNFGFELGPERPDRGTSFDRKRRWHAREVIVVANSADVAQHASNLVRLAQSMLGNVPIIEPQAVRPEGRGSSDDETFVQTDGFPLAMWVAAKTSRRKSRVRALAKYGLSLELWPTHFIELEPTHAPFHLPRSIHPEDHVRLAYSIVLAYAAIEELEREVRASSSKPSFVDGKWNPVVLTDLEDRLRRAGVDPSAHVPVLQRGPLTTIDVDRLKKSRRSRWHTTGRIGDADVPVVDAINELSFLRSRVSAHRNAAIGKLSPYDVATAQLLVRRLFLESAGAWDWLMRGQRTGPPRRRISALRRAGRSLRPGGGSRKT